MTRKRNARLSPSPPLDKLAGIDHFEAALADLRTQAHPNIAKTARKFKVDRSTLSKSFRGVQRTRKEYFSEKQQALTNAQEEALVSYVNKLNDRGFPPTPQIVRNIAQSIAHRSLNKNWVGNFVNRHRKRLTSVYLRKIDHKRKKADNSFHFEHFFSLLRTNLEKYNIKAHNIYNVDEKGFLVGVTQNRRRIVAIEQLKRKRLIGASQDGSREFITLLACICADESALSPALIYAAESGELRDTWLDDFTESSTRAYFACSSNGWSDDELGIRWLKEVFDRSTKEKALTRDRRLLILDGHNSHVNMPFIEYADKNRILLAVLPPHSTHRLQPLDIGLFSPLGNFYSDELDKFIAESQGLISLAKRDFWPLFQKAWNKAFIAKNIRSAWEAAGLYPLNPQRVIKQIQPAQTPAKAEEQNQGNRPYKTPTSSRGFRRVFEQLKKEGKLHPDARVLLHAGDKLAANLDIIRHENIGLRKAVLHQKLKRKRGKAMALYDEGETEGQGRFFSPAKVLRIKDRIRVADEEKAQHQRAAVAKKAQRALDKAEKAQKAEQKKNERLVAREKARQQLQAEKEERQAAQSAKKLARAEETAKRKREAEEKKHMSSLLRSLQKAAQESKKRKRSVEEENQPCKRARANTSYNRPATSTPARRKRTEGVKIKSSSVIVSEEQDTILASSRVIEREEVISQSGRSGRVVRLPMRYR